MTGTDEAPVGTNPLEAAYLATAYKVFLARGVLDIRIGERNTKLDALLADTGASSWAFVSAVNPASKILAADENARRHADLCREVAERGLTSIPGEALADAGDWPPEIALLILNIDAQAAREAGRRFGQNAVVWGAQEEPARLLWCL